MVENNDISAEEQKIRGLLNHVMDPEVPVLSVIDLGIIRNIRVTDPGHSVEIDVSPTYSGCPAMDVIHMNIRIALSLEGYREANIRQVLAPAWTTEWMSAEGKRKLQEYGIAPPGKAGNSGKELFTIPESPVCPLCRSAQTELISEFGSTACKSLYRCMDCLEPFDAFKCH